MSDYFNYDRQINKFQDEPRWLSWLQVQEQAVYTLDPESESEEELWARSIAKNGLDESVYQYADSIRAKHLLKSDHGYYSMSTVTLEVEPTTAHDWISSSTISPRDGLERLEFLESSNSLADRPNEDFFLGLAGLRSIENGTQDRYLKGQRLCTKCNIYTPKAMATCQNCEN